MPVDLSSLPFRSAIIRPIDFGGYLRPALGAPVQRIDRLGNRYMIEVELPPLREEPEGRLATAMLQQASSEGGLFAFPQPGLSLSAAGDVEVSGAVTGGRLLPVRGLVSGSIIRVGQYLSIIHLGQRYLHRCRAETIATGDGTATIELMELVRVALLDGDVVEIGRPMIEGWIDAPQWTLMTVPFTETRFSITERG